MMSIITITVTSIVATITQMARTMAQVPTLGQTDRSMPVTGDTVKSKAEGLILGPTDKNIQVNLEMGIFTAQER